MKLDLSRLLLLDGGMGTMLQSLGLKPGECPELLNLTHPEWIAGVHRAYAAAGSRVIYANTFGANALKLASTGYTVEDVIRAGVAIAREAAGAEALVAVDMGPLGALLEPMGSLGFEDAYNLFAEMARAGERAGADLAVIETMTDLYEAKAALLAVKEQTSLPAFVTMSFDETGRTFTGCTVPSMARTLEGLGADAIGLNCSVGPKQLAPLVREMCRHTRLPVIAKPNAGLPDPVDGHYDLTPGAFAKAMQDVVAAGASIVGGCCGTTPETIRALRDAVADMRPMPGSFEPMSFVCTPTRPVKVTGIQAIGERLNPTGKKRLQQALLEGDMDYLVQVAVQQMDAGAAMLDVNVGYPGVDEADMLPRVVRAVQAAVELPLQLDSTNPLALENALRVYNGKAAVNSVSGDPVVLEKILPIVKKYGAAVVGLTLDETGLPHTAEQRVDIARRILTAARAYGIPDEDLWIDCLTLTVSAQQRQASETLHALRMVRDELGLKTVLGVSNISFGLPNRLLMTQTFLIRAIGCGLTLAIVNPNQREIMDAMAACRVLSCEDSECREYVARFADQPGATAASAGTTLSLEDAVCRGLRGEAALLAQEALRSEAPLAVVEGRLIPALDRVGMDYERGAAFLPQLLSAAQAAQAVFEVIRSAMAVSGEAPVKKGRILLATVKGDIHDIGKNIVKTVLENYGFDVTDLGRDVPPETIVRAVVEQHIPAVGLSALMTTTLPAMEETVRQLRALPEPPFMMVGGAVVTEEYARRIGADFYAKDARAAAAGLRSWLGALPIPGRA